MSKEKAMQFETIGAKVEEIVKETANGKALQTVIDDSVEREVDARAALIMKGLQMWEENERNIKKCRPDQTFYPTDLSESGENKESDVKQQYYSEAKMKELNNLKKKRADLDVALMKALSEEQDYSKLKSLVGGK